MLKLYFALGGICGILVVSCMNMVAEQGAGMAADSLALQHRLGRALDSLDSAWAQCRAPKGCTCNGPIRECPDEKPPAP